MIQENHKISALKVCGVMNKPNLDGKNPQAGLLHYTLGNNQETLHKIKTIFGESLVLNAMNTKKADGAHA